MAHIGEAKNNPYFEEIVEAGRRIREAERAQAPYYDEDELPLDNQDV